MPPNDPQQIFRRYVDEVLNKGNMTVFDELVDQNYVGHEPQLPGGRGTRDHAKQGIQEVRAGAPDVHYTIDNIQDQGNGQLSVRWTARGTHRGHLMGKAGTGKPVTLSGTATVRIQNGKIVEGSSQYDQQELTRQLS